MRGRTAIRLLLEGLYRKDPGTVKLNVQSESWRSETHRMALHPPAWGYSVSSSHGVLKLLVRMRGPRRHIQ